MVIIITVLFFLQNGNVTYLKEKNPAIQSFNGSTSSSKIIEINDTTQVATNVEISKYAVVAQFQKKTGLSDTITCLLKANGNLQVFKTYDYNGNTTTDMNNYNFVNRL